MEENLIETSEIIDKLAAKRPWGELEEAALHSLRLGEDEDPHTLVMIGMALAKEAIRNGKPVQQVEHSEGVLFFIGTEQEVVNRVLAVPHSQAS